MQLEFAEKKHQKNSGNNHALICLVLVALSFFPKNSMAIDKATSSAIIEQPTETIVALNPANIEFPERMEGQAIKDLGVALQRHQNGRIKTYFEAGQAWQVGAQAISFANDFSTGTYAADEGIKITMLDEFGNKEFWIDAERACVLLSDKIGKCFGFVKLESPTLEMSGTNLLWNTASTNLFTIENNVTLRLKSLDKSSFKGNKK